MNGILFGNKTYNSQKHYKMIIDEHAFKHN